MPHLKKIAVNKNRVKPFKSRLFILSLLFLSACINENEERKDKALSKQAEDKKAPEEKKASRNMAKVAPVQGLYVFIDCDPVCEYETLGIITNKALEEIQNAGKNKNFIVGAPDDHTAFQNASFPELKRRMIQAVKDSFPEADAVILRGQLSDYKAIKFIE